LRNLKKIGKSFFWNLKGRSVISIVLRLSPAGNLFYITEFMSLEKLKNAFLKQFGKHFPLSDDNIEYHATVPLKTDETLSLYEFRYENYKRHKQKNDPEYERLLNNLKTFQGERTIIHGVHHKEGITLFFTDDSINEIIGMLFSPYGNKSVNMG
jgi:hypothetical protein